MTHPKPSTTTAPPSADARDQTGLLTRLLPPTLQHSPLYRWPLRLLRPLQLASSTASLAIFSSRVHRLRRLLHALNAATGAVEGILAAAVLYTLLATLLSLSLKGRGPRWLRWAWVLLDVLFVGAFVAVAVLTRPEGGRAGPGRCYAAAGGRGGVAAGDDDMCDLPWGTFALAIAST